MTTEILSPSESMNILAVEDAERELAGEFRELSSDMTAHILLHLGGLKVNARIAELCQFPDAAGQTTKTKFWNESDHSGRIEILEDRIEILHLIRTEFSEALEDKTTRDTWFVHLQRTFPDKSLMTIFTDFQRENSLLQHKFQALINELRCIRIGGMNNFSGDDDDAFN